jgi:hypothetical protein
LSFGADNKYPLLLLELFNNFGSPLHKAIINKKVKMSVGFGYHNIQDPELKQWARRNKLEKKLLYISQSFEIYNSFAIEVVWDKSGESFNINYLPVHTIRIGLKENEDEPNYYWYSEDWNNIKKPEYEPQYIKEFDPADRTGRQLLYYIEPNPALTDLYGIPNYSTAINYIDADYQIGVYHLNQIRQGFHGSYLLNFATGIPTQEEQDLWYREFQRNYKGAGGSGKMLITYSEGKEQAPELIPIQPNDSDERFIMLQEMIEKNITQAHECPIQLISTVSGKLGSSDERKELMAEFQLYYIAIRQNQIEEALNSLLETIGYTEKIKLKDYTTADNSGTMVEPLEIAESRVDNGNNEIITE